MSYSGPGIEKEMERILDLSEHELDYSDMQKYLKDLTNLAAKVTNSDISLVNLIDTYTQWSVSRSGIDLEQMPREESVCQYTIAGEDEGFEVHNLEEDDRFKEKFYVTDDPNLKYYFGIPLKTESGNNIGAICVLDTKPKKLDPEKKELLKLIANEVVKRLEFLKENAKLRDQLQEMEEVQKKVSHDIRGPLGGIIGLADLVEQQLDPDKAKDILEMIVLIKKSGESLLDLADQIMRSDSNDQKDDKGEPVSEFIKKLQKLYSPQARNKNITIKISADSEFNYSFPKNKLLQITGNLISNSIKFTASGGKVMVSLSYFETEDSKNKLTVNVSDNGAGMDQSTIQNILEGDAESTDGTKGESGFGYGLNLVQHLIKKSKGTFNIESEPGKGSSFIVVLPD